MVRRMAQVEAEGEPAADAGTETLAVAQKAARDTVEAGDEAREPAG